jgi:hypothetical protein
MSGNCAIGIDLMAIKSANVITTAISRRDVCRHDLAGMDLLNSLDDDQFALLETVGHDDIAT